jgi:ABC-type multidrug transport system fused ATPase/permease subunit
MNRSAFHRAWSFLRFATGHKWLAILSAAGVGLSFAMLIILLGMFADLMISRGLIPTYADLNDAERQKFCDAWNLWSNEKRQQVVAQWPIPETLRPDVAGPAEVTDRHTPLRWKVFVADLLENRVGVDVAAAYRNRAYIPPPTSEDVSRSRDALDPDRIPMGILGTLVRMRDRPSVWAIGLFARFCPWSWSESESGVPNRPYLMGIFAITVVVALFRGVLVLLMHYGASQATLDAVNRLRRTIYHHTYRLGSLTLSSHRRSEPAEIFIEQVDKLHKGLYSRLTISIREPVKIAALLVLALLVNPWLALAAIFAAGLVWIVSRQVAAALRRRGRSGARNAAKQLSLLEESLRMIRLVKGYLMDLFNQSRVERQLSEYSRAQMARFRGELAYRTLVVFLGTIAGAGLLYFAGLQILTERLEVCGLIVLVTAIGSIYYPLDRWLAQRRLMQQAAESAAFIFEFLDRRGEVGQVVGAEFLKGMTQQIEFDHVTLRDPTNGGKILDDVTLTIPARKKVAFVGLDSVERQAIASLLTRFVDPTIGEIRFDGKNIRWVTLDSLRMQTALVMRDQYVYNDTVMNNIGCGEPSFSLPQIVEAAKLVHAHHFIQKLPYGYETRVGDLGHPLDAGQMFRVALARAILRDPAVLIIEEPAETLDDRTKKLLDDAYARILSDRTVIFFPRRLSTLKSSDRVFVIRGGTLLAEGEHRELLRDDESYRHLYYREFYVAAENT